MLTETALPNVLPLTVNELALGIVVNVLVPLSPMFPKTLVPVAQLQLQLTAFVPSAL